MTKSNLENKIQDRRSIAFWNDCKKIGELKFTNKGLKFTGKADECAKIFFDVYLKKIADDYVKNRVVNF